MSALLASLEERIGYTFSKPALAELALTHISCVTGDAGRLRSYQRLEFLGDRVLGLAISDMLFRAFPSAEEGELSRRLAELVRQESCADVAREWDVGPHLKLGQSEMQSGGRQRTAILADVCESLIGAIHIDGGFEAARAVVEKAWSSRMMAPRRALRDAKTMLQEWAQGLGRPTPVYREVDRSGPAHAPSFVIAVSVPGFEPAEGGGPSKRVAEQEAAKAFMQRERIGPPAELEQRPGGGAS